jgi:hypothetical protein
MIESKGFIIKVSGFGFILFNSPGKTFQCQFVLLVLKVRETKIVMSRCLIFFNITGFLKMFYRLIITFDLTIAITHMKMCLELCICILQILECLLIILDCLLVVIEPSINQGPIQKQETVVALYLDSFIIFLECIIHLSKLQETISPCSIVVCIVFLESYCS